MSLEPGLWAVLVVAHDVASPSDVQDGALHLLLQETYECFRLLHGSLRKCIDQAASGGRFVDALGPVFGDLWARVSGGKRAELGPLANGLLGRAGFPQLPLGRPTFLNVQSIVHLLQSAYGGNTIKKMMMLYDHQVVWSGLPARDTLALYRFADRCMTPSATHASTAARIRSSLARSGLTTSTEFLPATGAPFRAGDWKLGGDGFVVPAESAYSPFAAPRVHMQEEDCFRLLVYQQEMTTLLLLVEPERLRTSSQRTSLCSFIGSLIANRLRPLEATLSEHFSSPNRWHISGYRYLFVDRPFRTVRGSPTSKINTLSKESLSVLAAIQEDARQAVPSRRSSSCGPGVGVASDDCSEEQEWEVCVRAHHDAWIVARFCRGRELYVVLEKAGDTLMEIQDLIQRFSESSFGGIFDVD